MSYNEINKNSDEKDKCILMIYKVFSGTDGDELRIFGEYFIKQNRNKCKIIYNNKKYKLTEFFEGIDKNLNHKVKEIKLKLFGIKSNNTNIAIILQI